MDYMMAREFSRLLFDIAMPAHVNRTLMQCLVALPADQAAALAEKLRDPQTGEAAVKEAREILGSDEDGFMMLALHLCAALDTRKQYEAAGIPDGIFIETMKCFTRFEAECERWFQKPCFDRAFWSWRQLSGLLYRLGELEFERLTVNGTPVLSVHIPGDARLETERLHDSYRRARVFFPRFFGETVTRMECGTWLLSPVLAELLPANSGIRRFQADYRIETVREEDESFRLWLYGPGQKDNEALPEHTSLQRSVKERLRSGGSIGMATGVVCYESMV